MLLAVRASTRPGKKYMAIFSNGTVTHFGGDGYMNYIKYTAERGRAVAEKMRNAYIKRHGATEPWSDPYAASTLSRYILWEFPDMRKAIIWYNRTFFS